MSTPTRAIISARSRRCTPVPATSPWARQARFLAGLSQLNLKKYDDAYATFKALADAQPTPAVLNNLGVVQLRRGGTPQTGSPTYYFNKAARGRSRRSGLRLQPRLRLLAGSRSAGGDLLAARSGAAQPGRRRRAFRARRRARGRRQHDGGYARARAGAALVVDLRASGTSGRRARPCPRARARQERRRAAARQRHRVASGDVGAARAGSELAAFYLDRGRRLYQQENDREAVSRAESRAVSLALPRRRTPAASAAFICATAALHEAIDAFKIALWSAETAEAHAALGEAYRQAKELDAARAEAERALALDPASVDAEELLARLDAR